MTSRAKLPLRVAAWPDELTSRTRFLSPDEGLDRPAADLLALMGAERISVQEILSPHHVHMGEVGDPEVRVEAGRDIALVRQTEPARDVRGRDGGDSRELEAILGKQELPGRLAAGDAAQMVVKSWPSFRSKVLGEWSDTTISTSPAATIDSKSSRLPALRNGGAHLPTPPSRARSSSS